MEWGEEVKLLELKSRDRDRLIARKKDILWGEMIPYYSTNRNDAWERWDELPNPKFYSCSSDGKLHQVGYGNGKKSYVTTDGTSFADAVSKAWLRWYYNTQWLQKGTGIKQILNERKCKSSPKKNRHELPIIKEAT